MTWKAAFKGNTEAKRVKNQDEAYIAVWKPYKKTVKTKLLFQLNMVYRNRGSIEYLVDCPRITRQHNKGRVLYLSLKVGVETRKTLLY